MRWLIDYHGLQAIFLFAFEKKMPFNKILFQFWDVFVVVQKQFVETEKELYDCCN